MFESVTRRASEQLKQYYSTVRFKFSAVADYRVYLSPKLELAVYRIQLFHQFNQMPRLLSSLLLDATPCGPGIR